MEEGGDGQQAVPLGERYYSVWVAPFPWESYANLYGRDISDRKQAEESLRSGLPGTSEIGWV